MKYVVLLFAIMLSSCAAISERRDWAFMESVGGLIVEGQDKNPNWLHLHGDVSGLREFSNKPKLMNSAVTLKSVERKIVNSKIQIYVITTVVSKKYPSTEITGVNISGAKPGHYMVQYLNPDGSTFNLKEVEIY